MVDIDRGEGGEFVRPKEMNWGLEPDEQVALFGNPKKIDKYTPEAFLIMHEKVRLAAKYLASFIPEDTVSDEWKARYVAALQLQEQFREDLGGSGVIFPESPQELIMLEGITSYETAKHRNSDRRAIANAMELSTLDGPFDAAQARKEYIAALLVEQDNFSRRGVMVVRRGVSYL